MPRLAGVALIVTVIGLSPGWRASGDAPACPAGLSGARAVVDASRFSSLQAAIDAAPREGGVIRIPPGVFDLTEPLRITGEDVTLEGSGAATHIRNLNQAGQPAIAIVPPDSYDRAATGNKRINRWRIQLSNFRITGNEKSGRGIELLDAHGCAVSANTFTIVKERALYIGPASGRITVTGNNFSNSFIGDGQVKRGTQDLAAAGITLEGASDVAISGNVFSGLTEKAVTMQGGASRRVAFTGNVLVEVSSDHALLQESIVSENVAAK